MSNLKIVERVSIKDVKMADSYEWLKNQKTLKLLTEFVETRVSNFVTSASFDFALFEATSDFKNHEELEAQMITLGYKPARTIHLALLYREKRDLFDKYKIVATGTSQLYNNGGDRYRPAIDTKNSEEIHGIRMCFGYDFHTPCCLNKNRKEYLFLGIKQ
jgi:hypothetical protein